MSLLEIFILSLYFCLLFHATFSLSPPLFLRILYSCNTLSPFSLPQLCPQIWSFTSLTVNQLPPKLPYILLLLQASTKNPPFNHWFYWWISHHNLWLSRKRCYINCEYYSAIGERCFVISVVVIMAQCHCNWVKLQHVGIKMFTWLGSGIQEFSHRS